MRKIFLRVDAKTIENWPRDGSKAVYPYFCRTARNCTGSVFETRQGIFKVLLIFSSFFLFVSLFLSFSLSALGQIFEKLSSSKVTERAW
jgi:hypothetical protein